METKGQFGLMELTHEELLSYAASQRKLTQLETEMMLRLEQLMGAREYVLDRMSKSACMGCPNLANILPSSDISGQTSFTFAKDTSWQ